jgi:predicted nucleotidyltransferase
MKEKIIFKALSGSYLYGTNSELSDKDIKGVFLPDLDDLILNKVTNHYVFSTNKNKNTADDIDETYYSLHYFFELLSKGDTNALDILFAHTNQDVVIQTSHIWKEIIQNIDKLLTKNIKSYLGYCKSQCQKYSLKGNKLANFHKLANFLSRENSYYLADNEDHTLYHCLNSKLKGDFSNKVLDKFIPKVGEEKIKFTEIDFGDHCYIETADNKESYLVIHGVKFQLNDWSKTCFNKVEKIIDSYGKRSEESAQNNGNDWKAISHALRVVLQAEEILKTHYLKFPLKHAEFIKNIKYKKSAMNSEEILQLIEDKINEIENEILPKSNLPDQVDYEWINQFILKVYKS